MDENKIKNIVEAALFCADKPLSLNHLARLFNESGIERRMLRDALSTLRSEYQQRGIELKQVASGYRLQIRPEMGHWVGLLWQEKPPRYSRALLETLALVAYRQPVTRGDIEQVRGVSVSQNILRTLLERQWVRMVGHREVPGRPALYGTTREFLDYFNLSSLDELPPLSEIKNLREPFLENLSPQAALQETTQLKTGGSAEITEVEATDTGAGLSAARNQDAEVVTLRVLSEESETVS